MTELKINPRFRDLCQPLSAEEFQQLEENVIASRTIRDPIDVWDGQIVDGHNRYKLHKKHGYRFNIRTQKFRDEDEACRWIILNQLGRRNSSAEQKAYLRGKLYNELKHPRGGDRTNCHDVSLPKSSENPAEEVAEKAGVTERTVYRDAAYADQVDSLAKPIKDAVLSGKLKAPKKDVAALADYDKASQKAIVESVESGEYKSLGAALKGQEEPEPDPAAEAAQKLVGLAKTLEKVRCNIDEIVDLLGNKHSSTDRIMDRLNSCLEDMKKWSKSLSN